MLFISATKDAALPPAMAEGMEEYIPDLTRASVPTSHWYVIFQMESVLSLYLLPREPWNLILH